MAGSDERLWDASGWVGADDEGAAGAGTGEAASVDDSGGTVVAGAAVVCVPGAAAVEVAGEVDVYGRLAVSRVARDAERTTFPASRVEVRRTRVHRRPLTVVIVLGGSAIHTVRVDAQRQRRESCGMRGRW